MTWHAWGEFWDRRVPDRQARTQDNAERNRRLVRDQMIAMAIVVPLAIGGAIVLIVVVLGVLGSLPGA